MDALKGIGHACGHNLIAVSGCGVALALKSVLEVHQIPGTVILLGTPGLLDLFGLESSSSDALLAEEGGGGKAILLERGAYKEMNLCLMYVPVHE